MAVETMTVPGRVPGDGRACAPTYSQVMSRLNQASVSKGHDPFLDIDWEAPDNRLAPNDPRLALSDDDPLARTAWYRGLDEPRRIRLAVAWMSQILKYGIGFEAALSRGLLMFAQQLPNRSSEYRYVMHEVVEEGRHSLMFQALIDRLGTDPVPVNSLERFVDDRVARTARHFPELFFFAVLGGEIYIDHQNRQLLRRPRSQVHPLVRRVMQIHVTEEARHMCFAERYLEERLPHMGRAKRVVLAWLVPLLLAGPVRKMLVPTPSLVRAFAIPRPVLREAFGPGSLHRAMVDRASRPVRRLCQAHRLYRPALWRRAGL